MVRHVIRSNRNVLVGAPSLKRAAFVGQGTAAAPIICKPFSGCSCGSSWNRSASWHLLTPLYALLGNFAARAMRSRLCCVFLRGTQGGHFFVPLELMSSSHVDTRVSAIKLLSLMLVGTRTASREVGARNSSDVD